MSFASAARRGSRRGSTRTTRPRASTARSCRRGSGSHQVLSGAAGPLSCTAAGILSAPRDPVAGSLGLTFGSIHVRTAPRRERSRLIVRSRQRAPRRSPWHQGRHPLGPDHARCQAGVLVGWHLTAGAIRLAIAIDLHEPRAIGDGGAIGVAGSDRPARRQPRRPRAARLGRDARTGGPHREGNSTSTSRIRRPRACTGWS